VIYLQVAPAGPRWLGHLLVRSFQIAHRNPIGVSTARTDVWLVRKTEQNNYVDSHTNAGQSHRRLPALISAG
jgi:hypothetical protein